jgi:hypothetical protein
MLVPVPRGAIYGHWQRAYLPLEPAVAAFEALAKAMVTLGKRHEASFSGLCHPVQREGKVLAWQME